MQVRSLGREDLPFPGEGNGNPLQYFCLENPMDRGAWQVTVHGVSKSRTRPKQLTLSLSSLPLSKSSQSFHVLTATDLEAGLQGRN